MTTNPIEKARQRVAYYQAEIVRLNAFIETAEAILNEPDVFPSIGSSAPVLVAMHTVRPAAASANAGPASSSPTKTILAETENILEEEGRPMLPAAIYERLIARGLVVAGKSPKGNLTAKFSTKRDVFHYDKDTGLWSLQRWSKDQPKEAPSEKPEGASKPENLGSTKPDVFS